MVWQMSEDRLSAVPLDLGLGAGTATGANWFPVWRFNCVRCGEPFVARFDMTEGGCQACGQVWTDQDCWFIRETIARLALSRGSDMMFAYMTEQAELSRRESNAWSEWLNQQILANRRVEQGAAAKRGIDDLRASLGPGQAEEVEFTREGCFRPSALVQAFMEEQAWLRKTEKHYENLYKAWGRAYARAYDAARQRKREDGWQKRKFYLPPCCAACGEKPATHKHKEYPPQCLLCTDCYRELVYGEIVPPRRCGPNVPFNMSLRSIHPPPFDPEDEKCSSSQ